MDLSKSATQVEFAELVGTSQQAISKYARLGILVKDQSLQQWLLAYCEKMRSEASGREVTDSRKRLDEAKTREALANAATKELQLYREKELILDRNQVRLAMADWVNTAKSEYESSVEKIIALIEDKHGVTVDRESVNSVVDATSRAIGGFRLESE